MYITKEMLLFLLQMVNDKKFVFAVYFINIMLRLKSKFYLLFLYPPSDLSVLSGLSPLSDLSPLSKRLSGLRGLC